MDGLDNEGRSSKLHQPPPVTIPIDFQGVEPTLWIALSAVNNITPVTFTSRELLLERVT